MAVDGVGQENFARRMAEALERIAAALEGQEPEALGEALAEGFPGREALAEAGVVYLENVPRSGAGLAALGLDGGTVNRVLTWLKANG